jgi:hypothetical protein
MARSTGKSPDASQTHHHGKCDTLSRDKLSQEIRTGRVSKFFTHGALFQGRHLAPNAMQGICVTKVTLSDTMSRQKALTIAEKNLQHTDLMKLINVFK